MKTICILLGSLFLAACSKTEKNQPPGEPISLAAGMASKAAVEDGEVFTASVAGWETAAGTTPAYGGACTWLSVASVAASTTAGQIALVPPQHYHPENSVKTCIKAWSPTGPPDQEGLVTFDGTPDGTADVLFAGEVSGSGEDNGTKTLNFVHLLSQIRFKIISIATEYPANPTLTSITVKNAQLPVGLDLKTDAVRYTAAADLPVAGITPGEVVFDMTESPAGNPILVRPFDGNTIVVDIVTSAGLHQNVQATIDDDTHFIAGKAYIITLTYTGNHSIALEADVTVTPWNNIAGGDGNIPL